MLHQTLSPMKKAMRGGGGGGGGGGESCAERFEVILTTMFRRTQQQCLHRNWPLGEFEKMILLRYIMKDPTVNLQRAG